jgi:hypothetical protein
MNPTPAAPSLPNRPTAVRLGRRRRVWPWLLLALGLALLATAVALALWLFSLIGQGMDGWRVSFAFEDLFRHLSDALHRLAQAVADFWPWLGGLDWQWQWDEELLSPGGLLMAVLALTVLLVLLLVGLVTLLPLLLLAGLLSLSLVVMAGLLLSGALVALVLAPLWVPLLLAGGWLLRRSSSAPDLQAQSARPAPPVQAA